MILKVSKITINNKTVEIIYLKGELDLNQHCNNKENLNKNLIIVNVDNWTFYNCKPFVVKNDDIRIEVLKEEYNM